MELKPDLVIAYQGMHEKYIPLLDKLFLLNLGLQYPQAVIYIAEQLYPRVKNDEGKTAK